MILCIGLLCVFPAQLRQRIQWKSMVVGLLKIQKSPIRDAQYTVVRNKKKSNPFCHARIHTFQKGKSMVCLSGFETSVIKNGNPTRV